MLDIDNDGWKSIEAWKIVELDNKGNFKTLFHGINGSKIIPLGEWVPCVEKQVKDGTSNTFYLSGWHVLLNKKDAEDYLKSFKRRLDKLKIVRCYVKDIRKKEHSNSPVYLARELYLP